MKPKAFTLIELLVVVTIIAILAAIAVPNFLEAQTRAKVSRVKADLRTLAGGLEMFAVDKGKYVFDGEPGDPHHGWVNSWMQLTTPVAYLSAIFEDPFQDNTFPDTNRPGHTHYLGHPNKQRHAYDYGSGHWHNTHNGGSPGFIRNFGDSPWKIGSAGPDLRFDNVGSNYGMLELYDPSNGTASPGDVYRSRRGQH